jgi:hypothetical protein
MNSAGCRVEEPGLGGTRRAGLLRGHFQQPEQPAILGLQLPHLIVQCR